MKKLKEYWNRMKVNKYVEMLSQGKNPKCNILFYAHGGSKYCVICKADMLEQNHRNYKQKKRMLKPTRIADRPVTFLEMPLVKRPRAKAIY